MTFQWQGEDFEMFVFDTRYTNTADHATWTIWLKRGEVILYPSLGYEREQKCRCIIKQGP